MKEEGCEKDGIGSNGIGQRVRKSGHCREHKWHREEREEWDRQEGLGFSVR